MERLNKIQLGPDLHSEERRQYEDLLHKYIHLFAFSYKDLREVTMEQHKIELLSNAKPIRTKQGKWNPRYTTMVKEELDKLLEAGFIRPVETTEWVSLVVLALKKNGKLRVCVNYKALNKVTKKDRYPLPFYEEILEEVTGHEMYTFGDGYMGYHQVKIAPEDQLKTTFTTPWGTFCYTVMPFGLCNVPGMMGYYRKFIHMFVAKARPLTRFLREDAPAPMEDEASKRAFEQLKLALQITPILRTSDWNKPFLVYCDASGEAVGSTLSQLDENGHDHPIHFASRQFTSVEKNYTMTEQEGLAVIFSLKKFHHYLLGYEAKIVTNHKALTYFVNKSNSSGRLVQWLLLMEEFDINIVHHPGRWHGNVNGLTKAYEGVGDVLEDDDFSDAAIMTINANEAPKEYRKIIQYLDGMRFPVGTTKVIQTRIAHKSRNYSMIGNQLYFQGSDGVL